MQTDNMNSFLSAAIQLNSQPDLSYNLKQCHLYIQKAAEQGADFIALPENFAFLGDDAEKNRQAPRICENVLSVFPEWAKETKSHILLGGFPIPHKMTSSPGQPFQAGGASGNKVLNRSVLISTTGEIVAQYDKIHLFDISLSAEEHYRESDQVAAGELETVVARASLDKNGGQKKNRSSQNVNIGMSICYDIRFPELYRQLTLKQADVLTIPAAFTRPTGEAHWEVLLRARAIENSCYVVAPAQTGLHGKSRKTYGHSMIIDPWGRILADAGTEPGIALARIDRDHLKEVRRKLPSLQHRVL